MWHCYVCVYRCGIVMCVYIDVALLCVCILMWHCYVCVYRCGIVMCVYIDVALLCVCI